MGFGQIVVGIGSIIGGIKVLADELDERKKTTDHVSGFADLQRSLPSARIHSVNTLDERVGYISKLITKHKTDPRVRQIAVQAVSRKCGDAWCTPEKNHLAELRAVFNYTRRNMRYVRDAHNVDTFQSVSRSFEFGGGDCDDFTIAIGTLLMSIGYPVLLIVIRTVGSPDWNHIYPKAGVPPRAPVRWVALDGSVNRPAGWEVPRSMVADSKVYKVS